LQHGNSVTEEVPVSPKINIHTIDNLLLDDTVLVTTNLETDDDFSEELLPRPILLIEKEETEDEEASEEEEDIDINSEVETDTEPTGNMPTESNSEANGGQVKDEFWDYETYMIDENFIIYNHEKTYEQGRFEYKYKITRNLLEMTHYQGNTPELYAGKKLIYQRKK